MQITCVECGKPFDDGDQCRVCVARNKGMKRTFYFCFFVGLGGFVGTMFNIDAYPPIGSWWWVAETIVGLIVIPAAIVFVLDNCDRLTRYATFVMMMTVFVAVALVTLATYFYLNGILDRNPSAEAHALVSKKFIVHSNRFGDEYVLQTTLSWNDEKFESDDLHVSEEMYLAIQQGDSVRVIVHPGEFSLPWYSGVLPSGSRESDSR